MRKVFEDSVDAAGFLRSGGELGRMIAAFDWSATPLGPLSAWPRNLKTATSILAHSPAPIILLWGEDGVTIYNDAYAALTGLRHPTLLGSKIREGWPEIADFCENILKVGLAGRTIVYRDQELTLYRHGVPEQAWANFDCSPVFGEDGQPQGVIVIAAETTPRVLADRRVAAEQARQRRQFEQAPGFILITGGPDHVVEFVNDSHRKLFASDDWIGKPFRQVYHSVSGEIFPIIDGVYRTGKVYRADNTEIHYRLSLDGREETAYLSYVFAPIFDEGGAVKGVFCEGFDTIETYRAQTALRRLTMDLERRVVKHSRTRGVAWQVSPDLLGALDAEGYFVSSNPAWMAVLGWSEEEVASHSIWELVHAGDLERARAAFELTQLGQPIVRLRCRVRCKDGGYRSISWLAVPHEGLVYCSGRDVTEKPSAEGWGPMFMDSN